jgi:hypothetical protein
MVSPSMKTPNFLRVILLLVLTAPLVFGASTNTPPPSIGTIEPKVKAAEACVERIKTLIANLATLQASLTNQAPRNECVAKRLSNAKALYELVHGIPTELTQFAQDDSNEDAAEERFQRVVLALSRVESLVTEANDCLSLPLPRVKQPHPRPRVTLPELFVASKSPNSIESAPIPNVLPTRPYVVRDKTQSLKQGTLAILLAQAMGLGDAETAPAAISALVKLGIEPQNEWQPESSVNLNHFSVIVAQALRLDVDPSSSPHLFYNALREQGLPIDLLLPGYSGKGDAPWLLESEVRRFFAIGLAEGNLHPGQTE